MSKQQVGVIGMAVMGRNLALNIARNGYSVAIYNRSKDKTEQVVSQNPASNLTPYYSMKDFVCALERPRKILIMVQAGKPTDVVINELKSLLSTGDVIVDGGNAYFLDTIRRNHDLLEAGIHFIGAGISGGEEGALKGPAIMPSGKKEAYELISPIFEKIAAKVESEPCVVYIGPGGAGHYVKMVHNGIEYGDMQLIAESYSVLKHIGGFANSELSSIFLDWNKGELDSYLIGITADIFAKKDEKTGKDLVDLILDSADNKSTGKWTCQSAFDLAEPLSLITESVFSRYISALKAQRVAASAILSGPVIKKNNDKNKLVESVRQALYFGKIVSYAQGFAQLKAASECYQWHIRYGEIAKIFRAGCIIRARFLQKIYEAYVGNNDIANLLLTPYFRKKIESYQQSLRDVVTLAILNGIPVPALSAAMAYYDSYRSISLPANLIQAQRDYFGAHTYQRVDQKGIFHTDWVK